MYKPRHQAQLGRGSTSKVDCGPRTVQVGVDALTRGAKRPGPPEVRARMGKTGARTTTIYDAQQAVNSYRSIPGIARPLRAVVVRDTEAVKEAVKVGRYVHLCIDYGNFNKSGTTGDDGFSGGHSVGVMGEKKSKDGTIFWLLWDPLDDARRSEVPAGPRYVKRSRIISALEAFAGGKGKAYAAVYTGGAT